MADELRTLSLPDTAERQQLHKMLSEFLITISDQMFENRDLYIDGYRFINCSFINCRLHILRGTFELHHCILPRSTRIFGEDSQKSIQFYTFGYLAYRADSSFGPKHNADGTISIGKGASIT